MDQLSRRTVAGGGWLFGSRLATQVTGLIQVTILARLLDPKAFGLISLAYLAATAIGVFLYTGYEFALIQKPSLEEDDVHTAWWVILGRYLILGMCLLVLASPIAHLYKSPEAVPVLVAIALIQPIYGLSSPSLTLFRRGMEFRKVFGVELASALTGLVVGVITAIVLHNVWSLVLAYLASAVTLLILSYALHPYRPKWRFSRHSFRQLSSYGQWVLAAGILAFVSTQGSSAFAGWMFGVAALGVYQLAGRFALLLSAQFGDVILSVVMPAYSVIQGERDRLSGAFLKTLATTAMIIFGVTALVALGLPRLLILLVGRQWIAAAALVPAFAIAGGAQAMLRTGSALFLGTGRPRSQFYMDLVQALVIALLLYPLGRLYGLPGLPFAMLGGALCTLPVLWIGVRRSTTCTLRDVGRTLVPASFGVAAIILVFYCGQVPAIAHYGSIIGIIWHIFVISIAGIAFLAITSIAQRTMLHYSPLVEFGTVLGSAWRHRTPALRLKPQGAERGRT
jgi:O-antigen/teichoic acid export membrane protein